MAVGSLNTCILLAWLQPRVSATRHEVYGVLASGDCSPQALQLTVHFSAVVDQSIDLAPQYDPDKGSLSQLKSAAVLVGGRAAFQSAAYLLRACSQLGAKQL